VWHFDVHAHHGALLVAVERLHRGVDIEYPRLAQKRPRGVIKVPLQPCHAGNLFDLVEAAPDSVFAHHLIHPQQRRIHQVAAQCRHVRITPMPRQYRQQYPAENVALKRRVRARVVQRAIRHPAVEHRALLEEFDEERQLSERRHRRAAGPLHMGDGHALLSLRHSAMVVRRSLRFHEASHCLTRSCGMPLPRSREAMAPTMPATCHSLMSRYS
jgi:hypothetical protein